MGRYGFKVIPPKGFSEVINHGKGTEWFYGVSRTPRLQEGEVIHSLLQSSGTGRHLSFHSELLALLSFTDEEV